jgi:hypothetical protein
VVALIAIATHSFGGQATGRPYRLNSVDLKQRIIWGAECRLPEGSGLAFGGQDQDANDGRPHTRILVDGEWKNILSELRAGNPHQALHDRVWALRSQVKDARARIRHAWFEGLPPDKDMAPLVTKLAEELDALITRVREAKAPHAMRHLEAAKPLLPSLDKGVTVASIQSLRTAQVHLELAAEALDAEPPPRAMDCGTPARKGEAAPQAQGIVYDARTKLYVIFGGDHMDYLTNDTWVFDPARRRWFQRHPEGAPPPRANHRLVAPGDGTVRLTGGYTYASNTDYVGGQYRDLDDGEWVYDIEKNTWSGGTLVPSDSRTYRTGPFHPDFTLQGERPDAAAFKKTLDSLPANRWVATNPPYRPRLNRDWGTVRLDTDRDMLLRWSGGHSAHGGTDVPHFHLSTNRWELPFPVEFPLGQLYSNTSYPNGLNFNLRPWITGHTYQNYAYNPPNRMMVFAGRPRHTYVYDPDVADWIGRSLKPRAMQYNSCFYTLTLVATPQGAVCWDKDGGVHRYDHASRTWARLELGGDKLPGAVVDNSTIAYDSRRDRILMIQKRYGKAPYDGRVFALDLKTRSVAALSPAGMEHAHRFAFIDRCTYDPDTDLMILASYLTDAGDHTPTPAYDCAGDRWVTLDIEYDLGKRYGRPTRAFPHGRSAGTVYDPARKLIWGTDTNSQVYVLRLDREKANAQPLR